MSLGWRWQKFLVSLGLMITMVLSLFPIPAYAADFGSGSAGDLVVTSTVYLSNLSNKQYRNITVSSGGNLVFNVATTLYASGTFQLSGGQVTASAGGNGAPAKPSGYHMIPGTPGGAGQSININAANILVTSGSITGGLGGKGGDASGNSTSGCGHGGNGGDGGTIRLATHLLTVRGGNISGGQGGNGGEPTNYTYSGSFHNCYEGKAGNGGNITIQATATNYTSGNITGGAGGNNTVQPIVEATYTAGANGGNVYLTGVQTATISGGTIQGGSGTTGKPLNCSIYYGTAANGGNGGSVTITGNNAGSSKITLSNQVITNGRAGDGGKAVRSRDCDREISAGSPGTNGSLVINNFLTIELLPGAQLLGSTGANGEQGSPDTNNGNSIPQTTHGGYAGSIALVATNLTLGAGAKIQGGTGGLGGAGCSGYGSYATLNARGQGGQGGNISLSITNYDLASGSRILGGTGGLGGATDNRSAWGGDGGTGGAITMNLPETYTMTKAVKTEENIQTGLGGQGNHAGYARYSYSDGDYRTERFNSGFGGSGGSATINFSGASPAIDFTLITLGKGGDAGNLEAYSTSSSSNAHYFFTPGNGGRSGDLTINAPALTLATSKAIRFASAGVGGLNTKKADNFGPNGIPGDITLNVTGKLTLATDSIYQPNVVHSGRSGSVGNTVTLNSPYMVLANASIRWGELDGGTLKLTTNIDNFHYGHADLSRLVKGNNRNISNYEYSLTIGDLPNQFINIEDGGYQVDTEISYALNPTYYSRWWRLWSYAQLYYTQDNGINWTSIPLQGMRQDLAYNLPTSVKGNSALRFGLTPQGLPANIKVSLNGVDLNGAAYTPSQSRWPFVASNKYAILDTDLGMPSVRLMVNQDRKVIDQPKIPISIVAFDNITPPEKLQYYIGTDKTPYVSVPYAQTTSYVLDLTKYYADVPEGPYEIRAKVLDSSFNTSITSTVIHYLSTSSVPSGDNAGPSVGDGAPGGLVVKDYSGTTDLSYLLYQGKPTWVSKSNAVILNFVGATHPYYQIKTGESLYSEAQGKNKAYSLSLPPGQGLHVIKLRYGNGNKVFGEAVEFGILVDSEAPSISAYMANKATLTKVSQATLQVTANDAISTTGQLLYSWDKTNWLAFPASGTITKTGLRNGLNMLVLYVKDGAGNIGRSIPIDLWYLN